MTRKILLFLTLLSVLTLNASVRTIADIPNVHRADSLRHVADPDNLLSADTRAALDDKIQDLWRQTSAEMSVVVVDSAATDDHDQFATELFTKWGIGKSDKDNGLLLFVAWGQHKIVIRTGYGLEGIIPDIIAGRIIRNIATPQFKNGNLQQGLTETVVALYDIVTDPANRDEILSSHENNANRGNNFDIDGQQILSWWISLGIIATIAMAILYVITLVHTRGRDPYERYNALSELLIPIAIAAVVGLLIPLTVWIITWLTMRRVRTRRRICTNCDHKMHRLDEKSDNAYLTPAQDTEEQLKSVDYDVWLCDTCGETLILPYRNKMTNYHECSHCKAITAQLASDRIVVKPTTSREGYGIKTYICKNCHRSTEVTYKIPRLETPPVVILPGGNRGGGGGGFSGGSFGGGLTGGGGASGSW